MYQEKYEARFRGHIFRVSELYGAEARVYFGVPYHPGLCWKNEGKWMTTIVHETVEEIEV